MENVESKYFETFDVEKLKEYERNPSKISEKAIDAVAKSIRMNGALDPIEIDEDSIILAGHTRLKAYKQLGYDKVPVIQFTGLTKIQKRRVYKHGTKIIKCRECGKAHISLGGKGIFCGSSCANKNMIRNGKKHGRVKKLHKCAECGKDTDIWKKFCSLVCMRDNEAKRHIKRVCETCGKEFDICKSILKSNATGRFCSKKCKDIGYSKIRGVLHKDYRGGTLKTKSGFRMAKEEIYDGGIKICALCGSTKHIHVHHMTPFRMTKDNSRDNLIPLCRVHHKKIEHLTNNMIDCNMPEMLFSTYKSKLRRYEKNVVSRAFELTRHINKINGYERMKTAFPDIEIVKKNA